MSSVYDLILRRLVQQHPEQVLALAFGPNAPRFIRPADPTLPQSDRTADALLETELDGERHLVDFELQAQRDSTFSRRFLDYAVRAHLRDGLPVLPVVIYLIPEAEGAPPPYVMRAKRREVVRFDFEVIRLWEVDFSRPELQHPALWALSVIGARAEPTTVGWAEEKIRSEPAVSKDEQLDLLVVLGTLAERRFGAKLLSHTLRDVMLDSPFWEEQREKVRRETAEQVRRETAEQVRRETAEQVRETAVGLLRKMAQARGGSWSDQVRDRLLLLSAEQIEQLTLQVALAPDSASVDRILAATHP